MTDTIPAGDVDMKERIDRLQRSVRRLRLYAGIITVVLAAAVTAGARRSAPDVLRARGLVIVDEQGRERILIGAPVPAAENRVRTDMERVEEIWGPRFPRAYVDEYYPTYRNALHGMVVLDENGFDRVVIGDSVPDPNIGRRIGSEAGILINDAEGFERSGYGLLDVDGAYRVVLGLDGDNGQEGVTLSLHDDGPRGLNVRGDGTIFLGAAPESTYVAGGEAFSGLLMEHDGTVVHRLDLDD